MDKITKTIKSLVLFLFMFIVILCSPSISIAIDSNSLINGDFNAQSRDDRIAIAKSLLVKIGLLDSHLKNLNSSEKKWVDKEKDAIKKIKDPKVLNERILMFHGSPAYQQLNFKNLLYEIKSSLKCIANKKTTLSGETYYWALATSKLLNTTTFNDVIPSLKRHRRLPKDIAKKAEIFSEDLGYGYMYASFGRGILEYIIIPYLEGNIK